LLGSFAWAQVTITNIPTLGGILVTPVGLNNSGQVVGYSRINGDLTDHAFVYSRGVISDLGTLGGDYSAASGINSLGSIMGDSETADMAFHAFLVAGGLRYDLGTLGGYSSTAKAMNNLNQVVGRSSTVDDAEQHAFLFSGRMLDLGTLGGSFSAAAAINNSGQVVGGSYIQDNLEHHAFLYRNGVMTDLGTLGGAYSAATAINDAGDVVGLFLNADWFTRGFLFSHGTVTDLGTLGGTYTSVRAINNSGLVIGASTTLDDFELHAFVYQNGAMTDLGALGAGFSSATAVNSLGEVVGNTYDADFVPVAFLWKDGVMVNLNSLLPADSGWDIWSANFINDAGQIVGYGSYNGNGGWYLLSTREVQQSNRPPVANAGPDVTVDCSNSVLLDGRASTDPDNDSLIYEWREGSMVLGTGATLAVQLPLGVHVVTLTVSDGHANSQASVNVTVRDASAPVLTAPAGQTVSAGANGKAELPDFRALVSATDNCTASAALVKTQSPLPGTSVGVGVCSVTVRVADASGNVGSCAISFTVVDTTAPAIAAIQGLVVSANENGKAVVPNIAQSLAVSDNCTPADALVKVQSPAAGTLVGLGSTTITVTVKDAAGNAASSSTTLLVKDTTAPVFRSASVSPQLIDKANGKMVPVTVSVSVLDNCDAAPVSRIISITSNEGVVLKGDHTSSDWQITGALTASLRAETNPKSHSRIYTLVVECTDKSGNSSTQSLAVNVRN